MHYPARKMYRVTARTDQPVGQIREKIIPMTIYIATRFLYYLNTKLNSTCIRNQCIVVIEKYQYARKSSKFQQSNYQ